MAATEDGRHGAITGVAQQLGIGPDSRHWVRQVMIDRGTASRLDAARHSGSREDLLAVCLAFARGHLSADDSGLLLVDDTVTSRGYEELAADLEPVGGERLSDYVYEQLSRAITSGSLPPGFRLREVPLARKLGLSTTPVREAIRRLEREGLVAGSPRRGVVVPSYDASRIDDLYEVRAILELQIAKKAATAATSDLRAVHEALERAATTLDEPSQVEFNRLDVSFHRAIGDLAGNAALAEAAERIHRQIQGARTACAIRLPGRPTTSHLQHRYILEAIESRDPDRAEALVRSHLDEVRVAVHGVLIDHQFQRAEG